MLDADVTREPTAAPHSPRRAGPAQPTPGAVAALHALALDDVRLDPAGLLGQWQARNAAATLPHCITQLERSGALANLRRLRGDGGGPFAGMWFADSDVYKTLEAAAWELARPQATGELRDFVERTAALLAEVQDSDGHLNSYVMSERPDQRWQDLHWSHATRADLLRRVGRRSEASESYLMAPDLAPTDAERRFLRNRQRLL